MFSKSKINDPIETKTEGGAKPASAGATAAPKPNAPGGNPAQKPAAAQADPAPRSGPKPAPSIISADLTIVGNMTTSGDMQVEGTVEGDIRSHLLTIGQSATIRGEVVADDVVVNGRVVGRIRGEKVRLSSSAVVEGDVLHRTIAIEAGAHFEGSVQRSDDPLGADAKKAVKGIPGPSEESSVFQKPDDE